MSAGLKFRDLVKESPPLHVVGVADGSDALEAERVGFRAIYASGSQIAASRGWADIGRIELHHVVENVLRILDSGVKLPLLVDIDTGFDDIAETIRTLEAAGAAAVHLEDQEDLKACGHLPGKHVVSLEAAAERISKAVGAKRDADFVIMARTDALAVEGMEKTLKRIAAYADAGADMIFAEAFPDVASYGAVKKAAGGKPVLANMTEFGKVALKTPQELFMESKGAVDIVLNPLTVYRAQRQTAAEMYRELHGKGTQRGMESRLQAREDFQNLIGYPAQVADRAALLRKSG
ncbi:MAG: isocitrate lyase/phosphoenolpyruvate mutase family protein [Alphaproteobacteria bacterium]|nr:isocitrate lyase/phosphoenolpyruvate mutase family protein [Alphaproteobacteria bacterium]MDE2336809.1 isocitrate lyase/phosphoenolpyruvate mutase family protein [Alphaproteobacteria bacterium]